MKLLANTVKILIVLFIIAMIALFIGGGIIAFQFNNDSMKGIALCAISVFCVLYVYPTLLKLNRVCK